MITVIDVDCRYDFEADDWAVDSNGRLELTKDRKFVATFAPGWRAAFSTRQEVTPEPDAGHC
jgi:hypothetical protein